MTQTLELESQSNALTTQADAVLAIADANQYKSAVELAQVITGLKKSVEEYWEPLKKGAYAAWKNLVAAEKQMLDPLEGARTHLSGKINSYLAEQERTRRAAEEALQREQQRLAQEQAIATAKALQDAGNHEAAEKVIEDAIVAPAAPAIVPRSVPSITGASQRSTWKFRVIDPAKVPDQYKIVDEQAVGQIVRALKGKTNIPGIQVYEEKSLAFRS